MQLKRGLRAEGLRGVMTNARQRTTANHIAGADDELIERDPAETVFVDPLSGIVIVVDRGSGTRGRAVKRSAQSPLWRSLLSRRLAAARAAGSAIIPLEHYGGQNRRRKRNNGRASVAAIKRSGPCLRRSLARVRTTS
jgi:hypothetical protein